MKNCLQYIIFFLIIFLITFGCSFFLAPCISDELWSYGFCYNIANGLIPYRDFNIIITPLFPLIGSVFVKVFGNYLFSVHICGAIWIAITMVMLYKILRWKSIICYIFMLFFYIPSYNFLIFLWLFLILYLVYIKKDTGLLCAFVVSLCFLTKQTVGLCLLVPCLYYSKNKIKSFIIFLIPIFLMCIYLLINNAFFEFIDYCFLGMFDFSTKNSYYVMIVPEILVLLYLGYNLWKSNFKNKNIFYILMFQIIAFPIVDFPHFFIALCPVVYNFLNQNINTKKKIHIVMYITTFGIFYLLCGFNFDFHIVRDNNFFYLRNVNLDYMEFDKQVDLIKKYESNYDYKFFILDNGYAFKLFMNEDINKFDILNNGNFGYNGVNRYINEIDNICNENKCVFFVAYWYYDDIEGQLNADIFNYVIKKYNLVDKYKYFDVYSS